MADRRAETVAGGSAMIDRLLLVALLAVLLAGCITVFSASSQYGLRSLGPSMYFLSHLKKVVLGLAVFLVALKIDYRFWRRLGVPLMLLSLGLLFMVDTGMNGAERWLQLGPLRFQPSELAKFAVIIYMAGRLAKLSEEGWETRKLMLTLAPVGLLLVLLFLQPNFSMLMVIAAVCVLMSVLAGLPLRWILFAAVSCSIGALALVTRPDFHSVRVQQWLGSFFSPVSPVDQVMQSYIGFGRGGLSGVGAGNSMQKYFYLPEPFNDFIFSIWGEEFGFIGCLLLLAAYALVFLRGMNIVRRAPDHFGRLLAAGITGMITFYALVNMMVTTGLLPVTGLPLPLFSFGGTAMVSLLGALGILMNVSFQSRKLDIGR